MIQLYPTSNPTELRALVVTTAREIIDERGTAGATDRLINLGSALDNLTMNDAVSAVVIAAAVWRDRYGSVGATERLVNLQEAIDELPDGAGVLTGCRCQVPATAPGPDGEVSETPTNI